MTKRIEVRKPTKADQPPCGGFCDVCGHLDVRHDKNGCAGVDPKKGCRFGEEYTDKKPVKCEVMVWQGVKWPEPWDLDKGYDEASWRRFALKERRNAQG
jgi:hypothetical protein